MSQRPIECVDRESFPALVAAIRPELHRYCARLTGSVIDGEDVVQDAIIKAYRALDGLKSPAALRGWLFSIAHHCALDFLRSRTLRAVEPLEKASDVADADAFDPLEQLMHEEAIATAIGRFVHLPTMQRSAVILKDVLGQSLDDIATMLGISIDAVKAHLARGRARLRELNARPGPPLAGRAHRAASLRYIELFNRRDWDSLRALLADDVRLYQATHPPRFGADVGMFFTIYARNEAVHLAPAWLEGREMIAVFEDGAAGQPHHVMHVEWQDDRIVTIRDYRYVPYVIEGADLLLGETVSPDASRLH